MGYHVRLAGPGDRGEILELVGELFGRDGASGIDVARRHTWLYEDNPHGPAVTWLAIDDDTGATAGCSSFFPRRMTLHGHSVRGALGGDCWVRPRFRRRGLGTALHRAARRDMRALGIEVMFGTPLLANRTPLREAGSRDVAHVARYVRPLGAAAFGVRARAVDRLASALLAPRARARLDPIVGPDARVDEVWRAVRRDIGIGTARDAAMYAWRFVASPSRRQRAFVVVDGGSPVATCALERVGPSLRIIELVAPPGAWGAALAAICDHGRDASVVEVRLTRSEAAAHRLWRHGFIERGGVIPLNIVLPEGDPQAELFWGDSRWYFTSLESDMDTTR